MPKVVQQQDLGEKNIMKHHSQNPAKPQTSKISTSKHRSRECSPQQEWDEPSKVIQSERLCYY